MSTAPLRDRPPSGESRDIRTSIWKPLALGLAVTGALLLAKLPLERSPVGERPRLAAYGYMQHRLAETVGRRALPVSVVDISEIPPAPAGRSDPGERATSRASLRRVLDMAASARPRAIGVDIDFAPDPHGYITDGDPDFFAYCQALSRRTGVPIYLGIERSVALAPDAWLGAADYQDLAASLVAPREHVRSLPRWTRLEGAPPPCPTLAARLALAAAGPDQEPAPWLRWAAELRHEHQPRPELDVEEYLVDYGPLERLEAERVDARSLISGAVPLSTLSGRVLVVGDISPGGGDEFTIPDRATPHAGVLLHACAVYTLLNAPLYELTPLGRAVIDVLLALCIILPLAAIEFRHTGAEHSQRAAGRGYPALLALVVVGAFVGGVMFVHKTRIMWDDFPLVILGLLAHRPLEQLIHRKWHAHRHRNTHPHENREHRPLAGADPHRAGPPAAGDGRPEPGATAAGGVVRRDQGDGVLGPEREGEVRPAAAEAGPLPSP